MMQEIMEEFQQCLSKYLAELNPDNILFIGNPQSPLLGILEGKGKAEITKVSYSEMPNPGDIKPFLALQREEIYPLGMRYKLIVVELLKDFNLDRLLWTIHYTLAFRGRIIIIASELDYLRVAIDHFVRDTYRVQESKEYCVVLFPIKEKLAVATDDGENIPVKMLGRAKEYLIFEIEEDGDLKLVEVRTNPYENTLQRRKTLDVYDVLRDCPVVISAFIGKRGTERLKLRNIKMFFRRGSIKEALDEFMKKEYHQ